MVTRTYECCTCLLIFELDIKDPQRAIIDCPYCGEPNLREIERGEQ
jgi:DNA-directed RNA polymerase subunit RPC12/RpoP